MAVKQSCALGAIVEEKAMPLAKASHKLTCIVTHRRATLFTWLKAPSRHVFLEPLLGLMQHREQAQSVGESA